MPEHVLFFITLSHFKNYFQKYLQILYVCHLYPFFIFFYSKFQASQNHFPSSHFNQTPSRKYFYPCVIYIYHSLIWANFSSHLLSIFSFLYFFYLKSLTAQFQNAEKWNEVLFYAAIYCWHYSVSSPMKHSPI